MVIDGLVASEDEAGAGAKAWIDAGQADAYLALGAIGVAAGIGAAGGAIGAAAMAAVPAEAARGQPE